MLIDLTVDTPEEAVKPRPRLRGPRLSTHRLDGCLLGVRHRRQTQGQDLFEYLETGVLVEVGQRGEEDVPVVVEDLQDVLVVLILEDQTTAQGWPVPDGFLGQGDRKAERRLDVPGSGFARGRCVGPDVDGVFLVKRWLDALPGGVEDDRLVRHLRQAGERFGVGRLGSCLRFLCFAVFVLDRSDHPRHNHIRRQDDWEDAVTAHRRNGLQVLTGSEQDFQRLGEVTLSLGSASTKRHTQGADMQEADRDRVPAGLESVLAQTRAHGERVDFRDEEGSMLGSDQEVLDGLIGEDAC